jgi:hypothetical protein
MVMAALSNELKPAPFETNALNFGPLASASTAGDAHPRADEQSTSGAPWIRTKVDRNVRAAVAERALLPAPSSMRRRDATAA